MSVQAVLRILNGPHKSERLVFEEPREYVVGRKRDCDLPVTDGYMSRIHFKISADTGGFVVEDLGSSHGTLLNGRKLSGKTLLQDGDLIRAGQTDFVFQSGTEVRALGTSSKTVMGSPRTMQESVSKLRSDDSVLESASHKEPAEPETVAAALSPEQLAALGGTELSDEADSAGSVSQRTSVTGEDPHIADAEEPPRTSALPQRSEPQAPALESEPPARVPVEVEPGKSEGADDESEWDSVWQSAPGPAPPVAAEPPVSDPFPPDSNPAENQRPASPDTSESAGSRSSTNPEEELDWWTA